MARPENWINQGYVPTPPGLITQVLGRHIRPFCHYHETKTMEDMVYTNILDPCVGGGEALLELKDVIWEQWFGDSMKNNMGLTYERCAATPDKHRLKLWGVEINEERATYARDNGIDSVTHADFLTETEFWQESFDVLYLNPPYDFVGDGTGRMETLFLNRALDTLRPGGIIIYVVPLKTANADWYILNNYCSIPQRFVFPAPHYDAYSQVFIMGMKREAPLIRYHSDDKSIWPAETRRWDARLDVKGDNNQLINRIGLIRKRFWRVSDIMDDIMAGNGAIDTTPAVTAMDPHKGIRNYPPLSPLRKGHVIIQMASGQMNNARLLDPAQVQPPIIVQGSSYKVEEYVSETKETVSTKDKIVANLEIMNLDNGDITTIDETNGEALADFLITNWEAIQTYAEDRFKPVIDPTAPEWKDIREYLHAIPREPISYQYQSVVTLAAAIRSRKFNYLIGEQGTGKTYMAMVASTAAGCKNILVTTPSHAIETWIEEIQETLPSARIRVANGIEGSRKPLAEDEDKDIYMEMPLTRIKMMQGTDTSPVFVLLSKDKARNGYPVRHLVRKVGALYNRMYRFRNQLSIVDEATNIDTCPFCWQTLSIKGFRWTNNVVCPYCDEQLFEPDTSSSVGRRYALGDYIVKKMPRWADIYIADEVHQYKAGDSAQGEVCGRIAQKAKKSLAMTGTFMGGKASEMFYIFHRFGRDFVKDFGWSEKGEFIKQYGRYKHVRPGKEDQGDKVGSYSRRREGGMAKHTEIVGYHPNVMNYILPNSVFIRREDIVPKPLSAPVLCERCDNPFIYGLGSLCWICRMNPEYRAILIPLDDEEKNSVKTAHPLEGEEEDHHFTQQQAYNHFSRESYDIAIAAMQKHNSVSPFAELRQNLMTYPENCWQPAVIHTPFSDNGTVEFTMTPLREDYQYPKEKKLIELVKQERDEGRKCLVYCTHTQKRSVVERLERMLKEAGVKVSIMNIKEPRKRLQWLRDISKKTDVVIVNPKSVETGLNLQEYPTMIWYEINESMYVTDQASARSTRLNQTSDVRVYFLAYQGTLQHVMLSLIASKSDTARRIYGEIGATGLSSLNPEDDDLKAIVERQLYAYMKDKESLNSHGMLSEEKLNTGMRISGDRDGSLNEYNMDFNIREDAIAVVVRPKEDVVIYDDEGTLEFEVRPKPETELAEQPEVKEEVLVLLSRKNRKMVEHGQMMMF